MGPLRVRIASLLTATMSAAVVVEGAVIIKTRRQLEALTTEVRRMATEAADDPMAGGGLRSDDRAPDRPAGDRVARPARLPPPRFMPAPPPNPGVPADPGRGPALPALLDTPEARDQLRQFVAAELQRERDERREQQRQARQDEALRRLDQAIKTLGLSADEGRRLTDVVMKAQDQRRELRDKIQSGQIARADAGKEMNALRVATDQQIRAIVGDDKAQQFQELQRPGRGGWPGGPGFGGPGPDGDGPGAPPLRPPP